LNTIARNTVRERIEACIARIEVQEPELRAFVCWDAELARATAAEIDERHSKTPLAGLTLGVKDIVDALPYTTECGSPIHRGRIPASDAAAVAQLRAGGAVVMGKTVTTEFAFFSPGPTCNPHDHRRTPGGSSSGSAAAVAAGFIDAGLGSQTAASITRPASFCGVVGFKPSFGSYSLAGVGGLAPSFDTLGALSRNVATMASVHAVLANPTPVPTVSNVLTPHRVGICRTPWWSEADSATRNAIAEAAATFGAETEVEDVDMTGFEDGAFLHAEIMAFEAAQTLACQYAGRVEDLSPVLRRMLDHGMRIGRSEHVHNLRRAADLRARIRPLTDRYDVLLAPSAIGEAPMGLAATGDPIFSRLWTLLRLPTITLPGFVGPSGMPVGIQLLAGLYEDERLLAHALWAEALMPRPAPPRLSVGT
jgi:Asp-tRNA(Asn)/Glu-tRNA(Gln) amidotransferase A subunit family amidase